MNRKLILGLAIICTIIALIAFAIWRMPHSTTVINEAQKTWLESQGKSLQDNTQSIANNICTASNLNMQVSIDPCNAVTMSGKVIQYVNFTWGGTSPLRTSWVFMFDKDLRNAKIDLIKSVNKTIIQQEIITRDNETALQYNSTWKNMTRYDVNYQDITSQFQSIGKNLIIRGSYYKVSDYLFAPGETVPLRITYTPSDADGKWYIFGYPSAKTIQQSILDGTYLYVDPTWNNTFNQGLISYYPMNDSAGTFTDIINSNNATNMGLLTYSVQGILGSSIKFGGTSGRGVPKTFGISNNVSWSWNGWANCSAQSDSRFWAENDQVQAFVGIGTGSAATNALKFFIRSNGGDQRLNAEIANAVVCYNNWSMITVVKNGTGNYEIFVNGSLITSGTFVDFTSPMNFTNSTFGAHSIGGGGSFLTGQMDEIGIWNRTLTASEVSDLYNGGGGLLWRADTGAADTTPPNVTLIAPTDGSTVFDGFATFNATFSDNVNVTNATFFLWNASSNAVVNQTIVPLQGLPIGSFNLTVFFPYNGTFKWNYQAYDNSSNWAFNATNFTITYKAPSGDVTPPTYGAINASPSSPTAYIPLQNYSFNISWDGLNGTGIVILAFNGTNYSASNVSGNFNVSISDLPVGNYSYYWWANDSLNNANSTSSQSYNITKASAALSLSIVPGLAVFNGTQTNVTASGCPSQGICNMSINSSLILPANNFTHNTTWGPGTFIYQYNMSQTQNYSSATTSQTLFVTVAPDTNPPQINITFPIGFPLYYFQNTNNNVNITVNYTVNDSTTQACWYSFFVNGLCYQEFANVSTTCGGLSTGSYSTGASSSSLSNLFINYTKPDNSESNSIWEVKGGNVSDSAMNLSIPSDCWYNGNKIQFRISGHNLLGDTEVWFECLSNSSIWDIITKVIRVQQAGDNTPGYEYRLYDGDWNTGARAFGGDTNWYINLTRTSNVYEEAMIWNMSISNSPKDNYAIPVCYANTTSFNPYHNNTIYIYANDTFGNVGFGSTSWSSIYENSRSFNNLTLALSTDTIILNVTYDNNMFNSISAVLYYNGTAYGATKTGTGSNALFTSTVAAPFTSSQMNISFYWTLMVTNATSSLSVNSNPSNVSITSANFTDCSTGGILIINYTLRDEETQINLSYNINTSIETNLQLYSLIGGGPSINFTRVWNNTNNVQICLNVNLSNNNNSLYVQTKYVSDGYTPRYNYYQNFSLSNATIPQQVNLYSLSTTKATQFQLFFKDANLIPIQNAIISVNRKYVGENAYKTVEMVKTDDRGTGVVSLNRNGVVYQFIVTYYGTVLANFDNTAVYCTDTLTNNCPLYLYASPATALVTDFLTYKNLNYLADYNDSTRTITLNYATLDGSIATVSVNISNYNGTNLCSNTGISSSGQLICSLPASFSNGTFYTSIYKDGNQIQQYVKTVVGTSLPGSILKGSVAILLIGLFLTVVFMFLGNVFVMLAMVAIGVILSSVLLGVAGTDILSGGSIVVWLLVMIFIVIYKIATKGEDS